MSGIPAAAGTSGFIVNVTDSGAGTSTGPVHLTVAAAPFAIATTSLPDAVANHFYQVQLTATPGTVLWILSGSLPNGMSFDGMGRLNGTPTTTGTSSFTVGLSDGAAQNATEALTLNVVPSAARNDDIAHATPITRGKFTASLSPGFDASTSLLVPADTDFYAVNSVGGATYTIESFADRLFPPSQMDTVIELVDANGQRLQTCDDPALDLASAPIIPAKVVGGFQDPCINDDVQIGGSTRDSRLLLRVPGALGAPSTFFVHVLEFRGMARPDFIYQLSVYGSN